MVQSLGSSLFPAAFGSINRQKQPTERESRLTRLPTRSRERRSRTAPTPWKGCLVPPKPTVEARLTTPLPRHRR